MGINYICCCECGECRIDDHFDQCDNCHEWLCNEDDDPTCYKCDDEFYHQYEVKKQKYWLILCSICYELVKSEDEDERTDIEGIIQEEKIKPNQKYRPWN